MPCSIPTMPLLHVPPGQKNTTRKRGGGGQTLESVALHVFEDIVPQYDNEAKISPAHPPALQYDVMMFKQGLRLTVRHKERHLLMQPDAANCSASALALFAWFRAPPRIEVQFPKCNHDT